MQQNIGILDRGFPVAVVGGRPARAGGGHPRGPEEYKAGAEGTARGQGEVYPDEGKQARCASARARKHSLSKSVLAQVS
jgi:hypothetical protein